MQRYEDFEYVKAKATRTSPRRRRRSPGRRSPGRQSPGRQSPRRQKYERRDEEYDEEDDRSVKGSDI